jgi:serine phosphatase RsbU (regulator of sigma subunit)
MPNSKPSKTEAQLTEDLAEKTRKHAKLLKRYRTLNAARNEERDVYEERLNAQQQMLQQTTDYLVETKKELEERNNDILASVRYARYIQNSILPDLTELQALIPESFIYYQPKDIVSGDLPGAMISMLGYSLLNEVIATKPGLTPSQILFELNERVVQSFSHAAGREDVQDGMDISLLQYNPNTRSVIYAGAKRPMFLVQGSEILEVPGGVNSVGVPTLKASDFEDHQVTVQERDMVYLFSDGFVDQFGEETGKKYLKTRFKQLCLKLSDLDATAQLTEIDKEFQQWKGKQRQTDDVLVLGLKF